MRCSEPPVLMLGPGGAFTVEFHEDPTADQPLPRLRRSWGDFDPVPLPASPEGDARSRLLRLAGCLSVAERGLARQAGLLAEARALVAGLARRLVRIAALQGAGLGPLPALEVVPWSASFHP